LKIETEYEIRQKVFIIEIELYGRILSAHVNGAGLTYNVQYYIDGKQIDAYFYPDELKKKK